DVGAAVGAAVAYLASWFTPIGLARVAESKPGFAFDGLVYPLGLAAIVVGVVLCASLPACRAVRRTADAERENISSGTRLPGAGLSVSASMGMRMALSA